ncbi:MAG TPA: hypothetical protein VHD62_16700 [Opitutaceae bacterium]|nr:hypothetical protein [Opitutaceae bacterium]
MDELPLVLEGEEPRLLEELDGVELLNAVLPLLLVLLFADELFSELELVSLVPESEPAAEPVAEPFAPKVELFAVEVDDGDMLLLALPLLFVDEPFCEVEFRSLLLPESEPDAEPAAAPLAPNVELLEVDEGEVLLVVPEALLLL